MIGYVCSFVFFMVRLEFLEYCNRGEGVVSLVKIWVVDFFLEFFDCYFIINGCGGDNLLFSSIKYSNLKW